MIEITLENFQAEVVTASMQAPVLLDIWAEWCGPCKQLGPVLEQLETEYAGRFGLAKLDADQVPQIAGQLSQMFGVRSIPFCVLFKDGQPIDGFVGALPASEIRPFLDKHIPPSPEEALPLASEGDTLTALEKLEQAVAADPTNDEVRFDYVKLLLEQGHEDDAKVAFAPVIAKAGTSRSLSALKVWMDAIDFVALHASGAGARAEFDSKIACNKRDFDARFGRARCLIAVQNWTEALDELLEILMRDKTWNHEAARKTCIAILEIMEPPKVKVADGQIPPQDPVVATYRRRLSSVVLS